MNKVGERLNQERDRARLCMNPATEKAVEATIDDEMIRKHMQTIVDMESSGMVHMLKNTQIDGAILFSLTFHFSSSLQTWVDYTNCCRVCHPAQK